MEPPSNTAHALRDRANRAANGDMSDADFRSQFAAILASAAPRTVREHAFLFLPASSPPWLDTGIELDPGEEVTVFATGRTYLSRDLDIYLKPNFQLWYRIGEDGLIFRGARCSHSFSAESGGCLYLASYFPGEWATPTGALAVPTAVYQSAEGGMSVLVVRWTADALSGLKCLSRSGDANGFVASEIERIENPIVRPPGWHYALDFEPDVYAASPGTEERASIACHIHEDAAILQKDVSLPVVPGTRLRWSWKVDILPSNAREDELQTHDYLSIAVEFDNGQDLTYFWSVELPPETGFRCPIPTWHARETHVVVRSGSRGLGEWVEEERDLYADYKRFVGDPPARIVRAWLIAVSLFRRREGLCEYGTIELINGDVVTIVN